VTRDEARQLRSVAELLRTQPSPHVLEHVAGLLDALADPEGLRPLRVDGRQGGLWGGSGADVKWVDTVSAPVSPHDDSRTYDVKPVSSSSSDLEISRDQEKKTNRVTLRLGDTLDDTFRGIYDRVREKRGVELPTAEFLWDAFVDFIVEEGISYATRGGLKQRWRRWCTWERASVPPDSLPSAPPASSVQASTPVHQESTALFVERELELEAAVPLEAQQAITQALAAGDMLGAERLARASERRGTGPPAKAPRVA